MFGILPRDMKNILSLSFFCLASAQLYASNQKPDNLVHNGQRYEVDTTLLEPYFKNNPDKHPDRTIIDENGSIYSVISTGLTRGYIADFEIKDKQLFVKDIRIHPSSVFTNKFEKSVFNEVFPDTEEVKADWVTGVFATTGTRIVRSTLTNETDIMAEVERGRNFIYNTLDGTFSEFVKEDRIVFEFNKGDLVSERIMDSWEYHDFINTDEYKDVRSKMYDEGLTTIYYWGEPVKLEIIGKKRPEKEAATSEAD